MRGPPEFMNDSVIVVYYISKTESATRYWCGEEGRIFARLLAEKDIEQAVYLGRDFDAAACDLSWADKPEAATSERVMTEVGRLLQSHGTVFFISDSLEAVSTSAEKEGCLPFLVAENAVLDFENEKFVTISSFSGLKVYFKDDMPRHLLQLMRNRTRNLKAGIEERNSKIGQQIQETGGVYIFGANTIGRQVYEECRRSGLPVLGFADNDCNKQKSRLYGLPILGPEGLDPGRDVVILASGNYSYDIYEQLKSLCFEHIQNLSEFFYATNCPSQPEPFFLDDLWENRIHYQVLYLLLADEASRTALDALIQHRQGLELSPLARICDKQNPQWFDKTFFQPSIEHVFVDGGGFDGDTALSFIRINDMPYRAIHVFELDPALAEKAAANLKKYEGITVHNVGLSDKKGARFLARTGLTDGRLTSGSGVPVTIDSLDDTVKEKITFLKLDVEGAEEDAITGSAIHISHDFPALAVAVYHKAQDLWAIPRQLLNIKPDYRFSLRHYTQTTYETVLYGCIGKNSDKKESRGAVLP